MAITRGNFSNQVNPDTGDELQFANCNFSHDQPVDDGQGNMVGVRIWPGDDRPRQFFRCNMTNCEGPPGSQYVQCNTVIRSRVETVEDVDYEGYEDGQDRVVTVTFYARRTVNGNYLRPQNPITRVKRREVPWEEQVGENEPWKQLPRPARRRLIQIWRNRQNP